MVVRKTALVKDALRDIRKSLGRFISILSIVALGVAFFTGLKITPEVMKNTADKYYDDYKLMDIRVVSTLGLTEEDLDEINKIQGIEESLATYSLDALAMLNDRETVIRVHSYISPNQINGMRLLEGRYPERANECLVEVIDENFVSLPLGERISLYLPKDDDLGEDLENTEFTVVGRVQVPYYLSFEKGNSPIGNGKVGTYIIVPQENFKLDAYTDIYLTVQGAREYNSYRDEYFDLINPILADLEDLAEIREEARYDEIVDEARKELEDGKKEYFEGKAEAEEKLADALKELEDAEKEIADGERELEKKEKDFHRTIKEAKEELAKAEADLTEGEKELEKGIVDFNNKKLQAEEEFKLAEAELKKGEDAIILLEDQISQLNTALENPYLPEEQKISLSMELMRAEAILSETTKQVESGKRELEAGKQALMEGEEELNRNIQGLKEARATLEEEKVNLANGEKEGLQEINKAKRDLAKAKEDLEEGWEEYHESKLEVEEELEEAWAEILDAEKEIQDIPEAQWYVLDRESHYSYMDYGGAADRIDAIAKVFPFFFVLVAALVTLTTMTRMVDEQRTNIGTLKALGYDKGDISFKYIIYALTATVLGCLVGVAVGYTIFPTIIFNAFGINYALPPVELVFNPGLALIVSSVAVMLITMTAFMACSSELKENAASLMRPKAPRIGKTVILEKIPFIWNRFNFSYKVTMRNLLRYKRRFFMTVFGIAGSTALLLTGFGVRDSIRSVVDRQFGEIFAYDISIGIEEDGLDKLYEFPEITDFALLHREGGSISNENGKKDLSVVVPKDNDVITELIRLRHPKTKEEIRIPDEGIVISKQVSNALDIRVGDTITFINSEDEEALVEVNAITENYTSNYAYISKEYYSKLFNGELEYNEAVGKLISMTKMAEDNLSRELLEEEGIISVSFNSIVKEDFDEMIASLGYVVLVIIVSAGALAFVVLYNLTNVNISERVREIATIKVLGFYDPEVSMYIYRENIILTFIGTMVGLVMGIYLHRYIMTTVEMDNIMFGLDLEPISYVYSVLLTLLFAVMVNAFMHYKLRRIPMVESLKSVD